MENTMHRKIQEVTWEEVTKGVEEICKEITLSGMDNEITGIVGIPRGGMVPATLIAYGIKQSLLYTWEEFLSYIDEGTMRSGKILLVDDISDTGHTFARIAKILELSPAIEYTTVALFMRKSTTFAPDFFAFDAHQDWLNFPWELNLPFVRN